VVPPDAADVEAAGWSCRMPQRRDWQNRRFQDALRELGLWQGEATPEARHDWEKAASLLVLRADGQLRSERVGLFVAAGVDPLYAVVSREVRRVLVTDRYSGEWPSSPSDFGRRPAAYLKVAAAWDRIDIARMDGRSLGLADARFDFVVCIGPSLTWFGDRAGAVAGLAEIARVLRPGGLAVLTFEFDVRVDRLDRGFRFSGRPAHAAGWYARTADSVLGRGRRMLHLRSAGDVAALLRAGGLEAIARIDPTLGDLVGSVPNTGWLKYHTPSSSGPDLLRARKGMAGGPFSPWASSILLLACRPRAT
jgi:SAM-dependent methyltransferase